MRLERARKVGETLDLGRASREGESEVMSSKSKAVSDRKDAW